MNEVIACLQERKSVRVFLDQEITAEDKRAILNGAMEAPSGGNQQQYTILDITDQELKEALSRTCDNQPFIAKAKLVLIFCADVKKWFDVYREAGLSPRAPGVGDLMLAVEDGVIAAQNAVTAAWSLGIGSCYIGDIMEKYEIHKELLHLPRHVFPAAMVVFGYPDDQQKARKKPKRCRLEDMVIENRYQEKDGQELRSMFGKEYQNRTFEEWAKAFCSRKYDSRFSREMSRSVGEYMKEYEPFQRN